MPFLLTEKTTQSLGQRPSSRKAKWKTFSHGVIAGNGLADNWMVF